VLIKIKRELTKTADVDVNEIVWEWFVRIRTKNHRMSDPVGQEYAKRISKAGED
jgi:hypothetical protein